MAFTFAHPAIVLPFGRVSRSLLSMTALIIGSMVPDAEYFIHMRVTNREFHTPIGILYFDLPFGMLLYLIFIFILRPGVLPHLPRPMIEKFCGLRAAGPQLGAVHNLLVIAFSILAGSATHLLWDSFTHSRGYFVRHSDFMKTEIVIPPLDLQIFLILQYSTTILGFLSIGWVIYNLPRKVVPQLQLPNPMLFWTVTVLVLIAVLVANYLLTDQIKAEDWVISLVSATVVGLITGSTAYLLARR